MSELVALSDRPVGERRRTWLIGPGPDVAVVFGLGLAFSVVLAACWLLGSGFLVVAAIFAVFVDFPHVLWTSVRVLLDPDERTRHGRHYAISLAAIAIAVATLAATGYFAYVLAVFVGWQVLHVLKQHAGMVTVYAAKAGYRGPRTLAKWVLFAGCLAPVAYRLSQGLHLGHYVINGYVLPFSDVNLPLPPVPWPVVAYAYGAFAVLAVGFVGEQVRRSHEGSGRLPALALVTIAVAITMYQLSYLLISDPYALILIATTMHSLQYHVISWARNRGRFTAHARAGEEGLLLARLTCPQSIVPLLAVLALAGAALAMGEFAVFGIVPFTLVLHHFYLDSMLWTPAKNPSLSSDLDLSPGGGASPDRAR